MVAQMVKLEIIPAIKRLNERSYMRSNSWRPFFVKSQITLLVNRGASSAAPVGYCKLAPRVKAITPTDIGIGQVRGCFAAATPQCPVPLPARQASTESNGFSPTDGQTDRQTDRF